MDLNEAALPAVQPETAPAAKAPASSTASALISPPITPESLSQPLPPPPSAVSAAAGSSSSSDADPDLYWLRYAIQLAHLSEPSPSAYCVGAVLVAALPVPASSPASAAAARCRQPADAPAGHVVLATGYSRELPGNTHAEECCFLKLQQLSPSPDAAPWSPAVRAILCAPGVTLYTTMEPCTTRLSGREGCTAHALALGLRRVVMGIAEPSDIFVKCTGAEMLAEHGVEVVVRAGFEEECWAPNRHIRAVYKQGADDDDDE
ncbi:hypothetical protein H9P43_003235 [Blastocladiella emersonii ATCC 22665]|nr:hypothetical protein H9P43_003235 [Blastocladiella emersonii ATCC 22665]